MIGLGFSVSFFFLPL